MEALTSSTTFLPTAFLSASVVALITSESLAFYLGSASFKLLASTAFVYCASTSPLITSPEDANPIDKKFALIIASSLLAGLIGDAFLVPSKERYDATTLPPSLRVLQKWAAKKAEALRPASEKTDNKEPDEADTILFKLGMLAFMLNHVGYIMAFTSRGVPLDRSVFSVAFVACVSLGPFVGIPFPKFMTRWFKAKEENEVQPSPVSKEGEKEAKPQRPMQLKRTDSGITDVDVTPAHTPVIDAFQSGLSSASSASLSSLNTRLTPPPSGVPMSKSLSTSSNVSTASAPSSAPSSAPQPNTTKEKGFIPELEIPADMAPLIFIYHIIISTMVASSVASIPSATQSSTSTMAERTRCITTALGAVTFMISDMFVAWDVFAKPIDMDRWRESKVWKTRKERRGWRSRAVGWMLYFGAQMLMARTLH